MDLVRCQINVQNAGRVLDCFYEFVKYVSSFKTLLLLFKDIFTTGNG